MIRVGQGQLSQVRSPACQLSNVRPMRGLASETPFACDRDRRWRKVAKGSIGRAVLFRFREMGKGRVIRSTLPGQMLQHERTGRFLMGVADKAKNKADELAGKAKAAMGDATDNPDLEAEGRMEESKADVKQAAEKSQDAGDKVSDALRSASGATKFDKDER